MNRTGAVLLIAIFAAACGGSAEYYGGDSSASPSTTGVAYRNSGGEADEDRVTVSAAEPADSPMMAMESAPSGGATGGGSEGDTWGGLAGADMERSEAPARELYAQVDARRRQVPPPPPQTPTPQPQQQTTPNPQTATDATSGPLLIYEAILNLAVYQVNENQAGVVAVGRDLGGYLSRQDDMTVVIRVPASKFQEAVTRIEALGDVLHRNIQALDVSEEFRDASIRLRNAEVVRDRLAALLEDARNVEESLRIERELERITGEIELIKGRLRFLEDRIGFSTITVNFSPKEEENLEGEIFHLPFDWLYNMGLRTLLNLR